MDNLSIRFIHEINQHDGRDSVWLAIANRQNETPNYEDAGIGHASTQALAAQQAVAAYFKREKVLADAREAIRVSTEARPQPIHVDPYDPPFQRAGTRVPVRRRVAVNQSQIEGLIQEAADTHRLALVTGMKVDGTCYTKRAIDPIDIVKMKVNGRKVVNFIDPETGTRKGFYLDLMTEAELA